MLELLALALLAPQTAPAPVPAGWTIKETTDAASGKKATTAAIRAADNSGRLIVRCDTIAEPIVSVQFIPRPALPAGNPRIVAVTFDETKAEMANWEFPGSGAYIGETYDVFMVVSQIGAAKVIRVTTTTDAGDPVQSEFDGPGSDKMFRQVYAACGRDYALPVVAAPTH